MRKKSDILAAWESGLSSVQFIWTMQLLHAYEYFVISYGIELSSMYCFIVKLSWL